LTASPISEDAALDGVERYSRDIGIAGITRHGHLGAVDRFDALQDVAKALGERSDHLHPGARTDSRTTGHRHA